MRTIKLIIGLLLLLNCVQAQDKTKPVNISDEETFLSNNPLAPLNAFNFHDYVTPHLIGVTEIYNTMNLRGIASLGRHIIKATLPIVIAPAENGVDYDSGLGDFTITDIIRTSQPGAKTEFGIGPTLVAPTAGAYTLGMGKWQAGVTMVTVLHIPRKSMTGASVTYQHSFAGSEDRPDVNQLTFQPMFTFHFGSGFYGRSAGASWVFDFTNKKTLIPFGIGVGKVARLGGLTANIFAEPQVVIYTRGYDEPASQILLGLNLQWNKKKK